MPIRRGKAGTDLGGQFIGPKSIAQALIRELSARGHAGAAKDLRTNPPKLTAPKKRAISRFKPSERELKGHARASADASRLRDRIATLDEDLRAPQHEGGRMSHPAERDKARKTRAELQRQLAELEPRVAAGDRNRQQNPDMYGDALTPGDVPDGTGPDLTGAGGLSTDPGVRQVQVENRVRQAYTDVLAGRSGTSSRWVGLADIRAQMGDGVSRQEVDQSLRRLEQADGVNVVPESNQKTLTAADRAAAVVIGDQQKHAVTMDDPSPRPLPAHTPTPPGGASPALSSDPATRAAQVDNRLRAAYNDLPKAPNGWVGIADLRDAMPDVSRADQDAALNRLIDASLPGSPRIIPVANTKALKPRDRAAAIRIAMEDNHAVSFENGERPAPMVPVPDGTGPVPVVPGAAPKAPRKAAAKVAAAKAAKRPASETAALVDASTTAEEAHAHLEGLSVAELRAVAAEMDGVRVRSGKERMRADIAGSSKGVVGTIDFAVRSIPSHPSIPKVARADLPGSAAARVKAAKAAKRPPAEVAAALHASTSREEAATHLEGMTLAELKATAVATGTSTIGATTKDAMKKRIVEHVVGFRLNSAAIRGGSWTNDGSTFGEFAPAPAKKSAAARVKAAKAAAEPPDAVAAKVRAAASEEEARQYLNGLTLAQLKEVAKLTGGHAPRKAELIDAIVYNGVGFRIESAVLRNR